MGSVSRLFNARCLFNSIGHGDPLIVVGSARDVQVNRNPICIKRSKDGVTRLTRWRKDKRIIKIELKPRVRELVRESYYRGFIIKLTISISQQRVVSDGCRWAYR